ncbi:MAG: hypothetical protein ACXW3E_13580, partial [Thermoanaerobaculia bacterium]
MDCNSTTGWPNPCVKNFPTETAGNWAVYVACFYFLGLLGAVATLVYRLVRYRADRRDEQDRGEMNDGRRSEGLHLFLAAADEPTMT